VTRPLTPWAPARRGSSLRHVLPNVSAPLTVELTLLAGQAVLVATALGFLGLGVQPPLPEWGTMLSRGKDYLAIAPHVVTAPGLAIALLVLGSTTSATACATPGIPS
jgi:ABC-type dipeptide/oligopeptide/nickel transport system permease subunit